MAVADTVIAMAEGYTADQVAPFVDSLRATGYEGDIVLMMSRPDTSLDQMASRQRVKIVLLTTLLPTSAFVSRVARSVVFRLGRRRLPLLPAMMVLPRVWDRVRRGRSRARATAVAHMLPVALARYAYYQAYIQRWPADRILLSDVRDVLFQDDPVTALGDGTLLSVFAEDPRMTIGACPYNRAWLEVAYGTATVERVADARIICSGVTFGRIGAVDQYLAAMLQEFTRIRGAAVGTDQSCHNVIIRDGRLPAGYGRTRTAPFSPWGTLGRRTFAGAMAGRSSTTSKRPTPSCTSTTGTICCPISAMRRGWGSDGSRRRRSRAQARRANGGRPSDPSSRSRGPACANRALRTTRPIRSGSRR